MIFAHSLRGETFLFQIVKMNLSNSRKKKLPQLLDQSKQIFLAFSANVFPSDQIRDCWKQFEKYICICRSFFNFTVITAGQPACFTITKFFHLSFEFRLIFN